MENLSSVWAIIARLYFFIDEILQVGHWLTAAVTTAVKVSYLLKVQSKMSYWNGLGSLWSYALNNSKLVWSCRDTTAARILRGKLLFLTLRSVFWELEWPVYIRRSRHKIGDGCAQANALAKRTRKSMQVLDLRSTCVSFGHPLASTCVDFGRAQFGRK